MGTRTCVYFLLLLFGTLNLVASSDLNQRILNSVVDNVNTAVDPCTDFYYYIGGNNTKGQDASYTKEIGEIREKFNQKLVPIFEDLGQRKFIDELGVEEKLWRFYKSCKRSINATGSEGAYLKLVPPAKNLNWPQFSSSSREWPSEKFNFMTTLANLRNYALNDVFFNVYVTRNYYRTTRDLVTIDAPKLDDVFPITSETSLKELLIRQDFSVLRATYLATAICRLDKEIRELPQEIQDFPMILTVREMEHEETGGLRWSKFLKVYLGKDIDRDLKLQVFNIDYFKSLGPLLEKYDSEVIATYIMVRFVHFMTNLGYYPTGDNSRDCINVVAQQMQVATKLLYEDRYLGNGELQKYRSEIQRIFQAIGTKLLKRVEENHFQLNSTQITALQQKILAMEFNLDSMPTTVSHRSFVNDFYRDLELTGLEDYPVAQLKVLKSFTRKETKSTPLGSGLFPIDSIERYYSDTTMMDVANILYINSPLLQEPFFVHNSHDVFKMSFLGVNIAWYFVDGILPNGIHSDSEGNIYDLFDNFVENDHYKDALECFKKSLSEYLHWSIKYNIAVQLAYDTYFDSDSIFDQTQPDFTSIPLKQLFIQNSAKLFVGDLEPNSDNDSEEKTLKVIFANTRAFSEAFQCPQTSEGMNPTVKCKIFES
ncbi:neprilysin-1-like [Drosophila bipectinata]|uniref:neprilysin-1-like n=1 Tax=Drosophila bipectinata TaxID=42026 RepID=UPI001C8AB0EA|nr:neprilysin-1-like [Drosophila bipectinata]